MCTYFCQFWMNNFVFQQVNENQRLTYYIPLCKKYSRPNRLSEWEPWEHHCVTDLYLDLFLQIYTSISCAPLSLHSLPSQPKWYRRKRIEKSSKNDQTISTLGANEQAKDSSAWKQIKVYRKSGTEKVNRDHMVIVSFKARWENHQMKLIFRTLCFMWHC